LSQGIDKCTIAGNHISIGRYTSINGPNTTIYSKVNIIEIGSFCSIARNVDIQEWNHPIHSLSTSMLNNKLEGTHIKEEMESKGGFKIGHGAIICANAVVAGHIPPYAIVVGNPAKVLKYRFRHEVIAQLLEAQWWNWGIEQIIEYDKNFHG